MSRTIAEIYAVAKQTCDEQLGKYSMPIDNTSKMSVMNLFLWVMSACIWSFENLLDVFKADLEINLSSRINGTLAFYVQALKKYQHGDELVMSNDGLSFGYATEDANKQIVSSVSAQEVQENGFQDKKVLLKIAKKVGDNYQRIDGEELEGVVRYASKIAFAGTHLNVVSYHGDILVPNINVYYDGLVEKAEVLNNILSALLEFVRNVSFDGVVYKQAILDVVQSVPHVIDVEVGAEGILLVGDDPMGGEELVTSKMGRYSILTSGYMRQSSKSGKETNVKAWSEAIVILKNNVEP